MSGEEGEINQSETSLEQKKNGTEILLFFLRVLWFRPIHSTILHSFGLFLI